MASITLANLKTQTRQRADIENSNFITDAELLTYINKSIAELHDVLTQKFGNDYFASSTTVSLVAGTDSYNLPSDFFKLLGVDLQLTTSDYVTLKKFEFNERNRIQNSLLRGVYGSSYFRYRLRGSQIWISPVPTGSESLRVWYVPLPTQLASDSDTLDGVNGWEEYVIIDSAIKCLEKEESDTQGLQIRKEQMKKRIEEAAGNRDAAFPARIVDSQRIDYESGDGLY